VPAATVAQRVVRAKKKVRDAGIPFAVPTATELPARLPAVLAVVGLVYTEGHAATEGPELVRADLCDSALRLAGLLHRLLPHEPEVPALRSLLLVTDARRDARLDATERLVRLADSDRTRWRHADLDLGVDLATEALMRSGRAPGPWTLQAAIAVANAAPVPDRSVIAALYDRPAVVHPSRAVLANRAAATALAAGPRAGLAALGDLEGGHLVHALRAELLAGLGRGDDAAEAFRAAVGSARNEVERRHLADRAAVLGLPPLTGAAGTPGWRGRALRLLQVQESHFAARRGHERGFPERPGSVEQALCCGWVDSKPKALDAKRTMLWFAPRKPRSSWSRPNKLRIERLAAAGLMAPAGTALVEAAKVDGPWTFLDAVEDLVVPDDLGAALDAHPPALERWDAFPRSVRRGILEWIVQANTRRPGRSA